MPGCMSPQFAVQEQPEQPLFRTIGQRIEATKLTEHDGSSSITSTCLETADIVKDQALQIASLQEEMFRERSLIQQYRDDWDSVRLTLQAARRSNESLVKERDYYQRHAQLLQHKVSSLEDKVVCLQKENEALSFLSRTVQSGHFASLPPLQSSLKELINKVGHYVLERELRKGESGNMVTVYRKPEKDARFTMKVINKSKLHDWRMLSNLHREVDVLQKLQHNNILQMHEVLHGYRAFYLIMEHVDMNLREYKMLYAQHQSSSGWIKQAATGVARALAHLHAAKIAHMDIKPETIMLVGVGRSADGCIPLLQAENVRITGFGSCASQQDLADMLKKRDCSGTLGYFAPDVTLSKSAVDGAACDMWSLGATVLEMTTGFCEGWMESYMLHASDASLFEQGLWKCLRELQDKGLAFYKDADLKDLVASHLLVLPSIRATAQEMLRHKWLISPKEVIWV
jgi:serine/threonine protein kinase